LQSDLRHKHGKKIAEVIGDLSYCAGLLANVDLFKNAVQFVRHGHDGPDGMILPAITLQALKKQLGLRTRCGRDE